MKKFLSLVLALVMTMSLVTVSAGAKDFTDGGKITYQEAVDVISAAGIVDGYTDGSFNPTGTLTRGAAAKIICNLILGPTTAEALSADTAPFSDVPTTNNFAGYIAYCSQQKIISGYADGTFRPGNTLTGYAFMKMLLGALGYDAEIEGFTGSNWSIQVGKVALGIDLDDGNNTFVGTKAVTREEACLYAFNTMKATMVEYDSKTTVEISGTKVNVGNDDAKDMENKTSTDGNIKDDGLMQFAEKYHTDLKKTKSNSTDDFGRPASEWKYKANTIGTYVDTSLLVGSYTESVERGDLYDLIGKNTVDDIKDKDDAYVETYVDGVDGKFGVSDLFVKNSSDDAGASGRGVLTEVYVDDEYGKDEDETMVTIVFIHTYLVQATSDYNSSKEELSIDYIDDNDSTRPTGFPNKIEQDDFDVSDCKEDDYLLVTYSLDAKEIQSVEPAELLTGEVDTYKERDSITIDGTKYKYNAIVGDAGKDETFSVGDSCTLVMDQYGFIMYVDEANATGDYVYLQRTADSSGLNKNAKGAAYFTDGTYKEITIKKVKTAKTGELTSARAIAEAEDQLRGWYTYSVNSSDEYTLKAVDTAIKNTKYTNTVEKFTGAGQIVENEKVRFLTGSDIMANKETIFLVLDSDDDVDVYTGLTNAPDITLSSQTTTGSPAYVGYIEKDNGYAKYVFIDLSDDSKAKIDDASSDDYMFVLQDSNKRINIGNDKSYFEYDVIMEGQVTTAQINDGDEGDIEEGVLYNKVKTNSDGYITGADEIGRDTDEAYGIGKTDAITHSKGTLNLGGKRWILSDDADINLIVDGTSANKDLLKDEDADFETYLGISGNSLAGYLKGYDLVYDYYIVRNDDDSEIVDVLYVWVTSAKENDTTGSGDDIDTSDVTVTISNGTIKVKTDGASNDTIAAAIVEKLEDEGYTDIEVSMDSTGVSGATAKKKGIVYKFTVEQKELSKIEVTVGTSAKTTYDEGEKLDTTGITVKATYTDNTVADVTSSAKFTADLSKAGTVAVAVSYTYDGKTATATYNVTVKVSDKDQLASALEDAMENVNEKATHATIKVDGTTITVTLDQGKSVSEVSGTGFVNAAKALLKDGCKIEINGFAYTENTSVTTLAAWIKDSNTVVVTNGGASEAYIINVVETEAVGG